MYPVVWEARDVEISNSRINGGGAVELSKRAILGYLPLPEGFRIAPDPLRASGMGIVGLEAT